MRITPIRITLLIVLIIAAASKADAQMLRAELNIAPRPSMRLSDWESRRETATLMIFSTDQKNTEIRIDAKLSLNGVLIASTKLGSMPVLTIPFGGPAIFYAGDLFPENAVSFFGDLKSSTMRTGILPEGTYELCITLVSALTMQPVSASTCRNFSLTKNILPVLLQPEDNKKIVSGTEKTTLFVWSPMIPIPQNPVIYRLRVTEILQGQTAQQAFNVNTPLFERTVMGGTQLLWPQEIPLPSAGATLAWGVQPEDDQGNPYVIPERFTNPFDLIVLPSKEECAKMLEKIQKLRDDGLLIEENYWTAYDHFARVTEVLEAAEERADIIAIEKARKDQKNADMKLAKFKTFFETSRAKYDAAITKYEECVGK